MFAKKDKMKKNVQYKAFNLKMYTKIMEYNVIERVHIKKCLLKY